MAPRNGWTCPVGQHDARRPHPHPHPHPPEVQAPADKESCDSFRTIYTANNDSGSSGTEQNLLTQRAN
ncbi:hypothetical protein BDN67DRAFT_973917, partial [Paxillus ammoniavirescens]